MAKVLFSLVLYSPSWYTIVGSLFRRENPMDLRQQVNYAQRVVALCLVLLLSSALVGARAESSPSTFIPLVLAPAVCQLNEQEQAVAELLATDPGQQRPYVACDPILAKVARERAQDMIDRNYFGHVNPDGQGANYLVEAEGYLLPTWYNHSPSGNNIESIAAGQVDAAETWAAWRASSLHRKHILGDPPTFITQTNYGIGYAYSATSTYKHYWVIITAPPQL